MKFLRSWLEEYINLDGLGDEFLAEKITNNSSEVEEILQIEDWFENKVLVGKIKNVKNHPNADRLKIFNVFIGENKSVQIVSAATNVRENLLIPVAIDGAKLPGLIIMGREMRGEKSEGMCCGKSELLQENGYSAGLWELENDGVNDTQIGQSICKVFPQIFPKQTVFDIKILPNKFADISNYLGMAIEISICLKNPNLLKGLAKEAWENSQKVLERGENLIKNLEKSELDFKIEDKVNYVKSLKILELKNIKNLTIPKEILTRLFLSQSNILANFSDLSNYLMLDVGQGNHFFDLDVLKKFEQGKIHWRVEENQSEANFKGLGNFSDLKIQKNSIVLKQNNQILSLFGVVGGEKTKIGEKTENILLEIPSFDPQMVQKNSFLNHARTDASKLWANGADAGRTAVFIINLVENLQKMGADLENLKTVFNQELKEKKLSVKIDYKYLIDRLKCGLNQEKIDKILAFYGKVENGNLIIKNEFYNHIKGRETMLTAVFEALDKDNFENENLYAPVFSQKSEENLEQRIIDWGTKQGFDQIISRPFTALKNENQIEVLKPQNVDLNALRDNLTETLLTIFKQNLEQKIKNPKIFETGKIYTKNEGKLQEKNLICFVFSTPDPYEATTLIYNFGLFGQNRVEFLEKKLTNFGQEHIFKIGKSIGKIIEISNKIKKNFGLPLNKNMWAVEIEIVNLEKKENKKYVQISDFPVVTRSVSLVLKNGQNFENIKNYLQSYEDLNITVFPLERFKNEEGEILNLDLEISKNGTISGQELAKFEEYVKLGPIEKIR